MGTDCRFVDAVKMDMWVGVACIGDWNVVNVIVREPIFINVS